MGPAKPPEPRYALVTTPIAHLQAHPDHQSELVSQRLHGDVLRVDGGRPQGRKGCPMQRPDEEAEQRDAVRPFEGFHRALVPKVFKS